MSRGIFKQGSGYNVKDDVLLKRQELRVESYDFSLGSRVEYRLGPPPKLSKRCRLPSAINAVLVKEPH